MSDKTHIDEWQFALRSKKEELLKCQVHHNLDSCLKCHEILKCDLRDAYIKSVYDSMNKGSSGGFEF